MPRGPSQARVWSSFHSPDHRLPPAGRRERPRRRVRSSANTTHGPRLGLDPADRIGSGARSGAFLPAREAELEAVPARGERHALVDPPIRVGQRRERSRPAMSVRASRPSEQRLRRAAHRRAVRDSRVPAYGIRARSRPSRASPSCDRVRRSGSTGSPSRDSSARTPRLPLAGATARVRARPEPTPPRSGSPSLPAGGAMPVSRATSSARPAASALLEGLPPQLAGGAKPAAAHEERRRHLQVHQHRHHDMFVRRQVVVERDRHGKLGPAPPAHCRLQDLAGSDHPVGAT